MQRPTIAVLLILTIVPGTAGAQIPEAEPARLGEQLQQQGPRAGEGDAFEAREEAVPAKLSFEETMRLLREPGFHPELAPILGTGLPASSPKSGQISGFWGTVLGVAIVAAICAAVIIAVARELPRPLG